MMFMTIKFEQNNKFNAITRIRVINNKLVSLIL
jgi:hypothetical protein